MSVFLSPVGGAGAQFFDNNGNPLVGGKIYTYEAGTTTPLATYTTLAGTTAHTNPIILDSAGRVPGGEIWLTLPDLYKFVLKTSADVTIGTYDNIQGYSSGSIVSVKDFGAVGDGVTNDTTAFTACRTATGGKYLIPPGSYVVDASPNVWEDSFVAPYGSTSLIISATTYNISGSFGGGWRSEVTSQTYLTWTNASSGATLARWSDGASASDSHQFYLPLEVFRDSHGFMLRHGTVGGNSDILYQDSTSTDMFYLQSVGDAANCTFNFLYDATPGVAGGFDTVFQVVNASGVATLNTNVAAKDTISRTFVKRSAPTYQWVLTPDATTFTLKSQNTSGVDQATLVDYGQYTVTTTGKKQAVYAGLPFTGRIANSFSEAGSLTGVSSRTFALVGASNFAMGTVIVTMVGSSGGDRYYKADFKFDGTTLTTSTSSLNSGSVELTVSFSVVSSQVELTIGYTGGLGGSARYSVDVDVATVTR